MKNNIKKTDVYEQAADDIVAGLVAVATRLIDEFERHFKVKIEKERKDAIYDAAAAAMPEFLENFGDVLVLEHDKKKFYGVWGLVMQNIIKLICAELIEPDKPKVH